MEVAQHVTTRLETLGVGDEPVDEPRTVSLRRDAVSADRVGDVMGKLPRLLEHGEADTAPELRIKGALGEGGMGIVELAEQLSVGREVAVKKVRDDEDDDARLVLLREGWTTGLLEHPNIIPVYTVGRTDDDEPVIVMKKVSGTSWQEIIEDPSRAPKAFRREDTLDMHLDVLIQVCNAVDYAHSRGIVHRDIKPENIMLGEFGEVYLLDWGIALSMEDESSGRLRTSADVTGPEGTPAYMAPEMVDEEMGVVSEQTDVFLLGATLYEILTGEPPYGGATVYALMIEAFRCEPPQFDASVDPKLQEICRRAMAKNPGDRHLGVRQLKEALVAYRRHRQAARLATEGQRRLEEIRLHLDREERGDDDVDETALDRAFTEGRFSFEQALEIHGQSEVAENGLQTILELMIDRELRREALGAAESLWSALPRPNEELRQQLDGLKHDLARRDRDLQDLRKFRDDVDLDVGRRGRVRLVLAAATLIVIGSVAKNLLVEAGWLTRSYPLAVMGLAGLTGLAGGLYWLGRRRLFGGANQKMALCLVTVLGCAAIHRAIGWQAQMPYDEVLVVELQIYVVGAWLLALAYDWRLIAVGICYLAACLIGGWMPQIAHWMPAMGTVGAAAALSFLWWPRPVEVDNDGR